MAKQFWLVKSEPSSFSIQDLARSPKKTTSWDGVRNYQARNFMRAMKQGDCVLFYHSSTDPPAAVGTATVVREAYPDDTALDPKDHHYDPKASREKPIWEMVDIQLFEIFPEPVPLATLRTLKELANMELLRKGSRLSVQPVRPKEFDAVVDVGRGNRKSPEGASAGKAGAAKKPTGVKAAKKRKKKPTRKK